jgi:hypothetical protein
VVLMAAAEPILVQGTQADVEGMVVVPMEPAANVIAAIARVEAEIGGIAKRTSEQRGGSHEQGVKYPYRGIDEIAAQAQPLMGKHGVVIVPRILTRDTIEIVVNQKPWTDTIVMVEWTIYGPGGVTDHIVSTTEGWGRDNSDKGINKAMTGAYKNLMLRLLCIGDPKDDTDGTTSERDSHQPQAHTPDPVEVEVRDLWARIKAAGGTPMADTLKELAASQGHKLTEIGLAQDADWRAMVTSTLDAVAAETPAGVNTETGELLDAGRNAAIDILMESLAELNKAGKPLTREAFIADPDWAQEAARILLTPPDDESPIDQHGEPS